MNPTAILTAINTAKVAIDTALKVKDSLFGTNALSKSDSSISAKTSDTIDALQVEIELQNKRIDELATFVDKNRIIIQEQNEIIIGLSNALKVTAESVQRQRTIMLAAALVSSVAILISVYVLTR